MDSEKCNLKDDIIVFLMFTNLVRSFNDHRIFFFFRFLTFSLGISLLLASKNISREYISLLFHILAQKHQWAWNLGLNPQPTHV
jgi:hypothetical protein